MFVFVFHNKMFVVSVILLEVAGCVVVVVVTVCVAVAARSLQPVSLNLAVIEAPRS